MKPKKLVIVFLLFGVVGFMVGKTVLDSFKNDGDNIVRIQTILQDTCNCESIEKSMYSKGIQFDKEQGFSTEKAEFVLTNCKYDNLNDEANRIANQLKAEGLETFNLLALDFISEKKQETITIKHGNVQ